MSVRNLLITDETNPDYGKIDPAFIETKNHPPIQQTVQSYLFASTLALPIDILANNVEQDVGKPVADGIVVPFTFPKFGAGYVFSTFTMRFDLKINFSNVPASPPEFLLIYAYINNVTANYASQYILFQNPSADPPNTRVWYDGNDGAGVYTYKGVLNYSDYFGFSPLTQGTPFDNQKLFFGGKPPLYNPDGSAFVGNYTIKQNSAIKIITSFEMCN